MDRLNIDRDDLPVVLAWLVAALFADIPHPILGLFAEQGTGKTTAAKVLSSLVDPSPVPIRKAPKDPDSWVTAAAGSWVVTLDNLSTLPDWLSDSLCRAVTGDGDVRRKLYSDNELVTFSYRRCIIVTGIDLGAVNGDFADRLLPITLKGIDEQQRRDERDVWAGWADDHPIILGALLDLTVDVLGVLPSVAMDRRPRMADFARVLAAVDKVLGTDGYTRYLDSVRSVATDSLSGDDFITAIAHTFARSTFTGSSGELLAAVTPGDERAGKDWPGNARAVTARLHRQAPVMRKAGWTVDEIDDKHAKHIRWTITPPENEMAGNPYPQPPQPPHDDDPDAEVAEVAGVDSLPPHVEHHATELTPGNPLCTVCGKPNLFSRVSIERGICASCINKETA